MAEDVIAARGPAGPAEPAAQPAPEGEESGEQLTRGDRARRSAYRNRFVAVYFGLAIVLGIGIGALAVALRSPQTTHAKPATGFSPATSGELGAIDLAANLQRTYRRADGGAFVDIIATRNLLQDGNLGLLRVRYQIIQPRDANKSRDSRILRPQDAIQYSLCGTETNCAVPGTVSAASGALLRREALELALRTFQHDGKVDNVVVFLRPVPPPQGSNYDGFVLMLNRCVIGRNDPVLLSRPIATTLPGAGAKKITQAQMTPDQIERIDELTKPYLYLYRYQLAGGRDAVMELQPLPA